MKAAFITKENLHAGAAILLTLFLLSSGTLLAPTSKLMAFNAEYFGISGFEFLSPLLIAGLAASILLFALIAVLCRGRLTEARLSSKTISSHGASLVYFLLLLFLSSSVLLSFLIPVHLAPLDGPISFEVRREALCGSAAVAVLFIVGVALKIGAFNIYSRIFTGLRTLFPFELLYAAGFAVYSLAGIPLYGVTGSVESTAGFGLGSKNVFILSFDQVQGSFVSRLLKEDPEAQAVFDGFTLYPDAASTYPNTNYSLASTLLGRRALSSAESREEAILSPQSFLAASAATGATVYTNDPTNLAISEYSCLNCGDHNVFNHSKVYELIRHAINLAFGIDLHQTVARDLFSSLGAIDASNTMQEYDWKNDLHKFRALVQATNHVEADSNVYFMHFLGTHQPFTYDRNCTLMSREQIEESQNSRGAADVAHCMFNLSRELIAKLKQLGAYENSTIFLVSDHGYEANIQESQPFADYFPYTASIVGDARNIKPAGSYNPILFFKPEGSRGSMKYNYSAVSLIDIAPTVCAALNCDDSYAWPGYDLIAGNPPPEREREFWMYLGSSDRRTLGGGDKLHDGLDEYWEHRTFSGQVFPNLAIAMGLDKAYALRLLGDNELIVFSKGGNSHIYTKAGWHQAEATHRWTDGSHAELRVRLAEPSTNDLTINFEIIPYRNETIGHQNVEVEINSQPVATWRVEDAGRYSARVPSALAAGGQLDITLRISSPAAPCRTGHSADCRELGIAAKKMWITSTTVE